MSKELVLAPIKETEMHVLGCILLDGKLPTEVLGALAPYDFSSVSHKLIFESMTAMHNSGTAIDILSLPQHLESRNVLTQVGGSAYIAELLNWQLGRAKLDASVDSLRRRTTRRKLMSFGGKLAERATQETEDLLEMAGDMKKLADTVKLRHSDTASMSLNDIVRERLEHAERVSQDPNLAAGVPTGYGLLDYLTAGLQKGDSVLLAARPAQGKTALALNITQAAAAAGKKVLFISLEMTKEQLVARLLCSIAQIDLIAYRRGSLSRQEWERLGKAQATIAEYGDNITILDESKLTVSALEGLARTKKKESGLELLVVDYLQLIRPERNKDRRLEVGQISRDSKALAKELEIPVLNLCQMNRAVEQRSSKRPMLSDLREAGDLEQDADMVWFLYYPNGDEEDKADVKQVELIIGKQRNGPTGSIPLMFLSKHTKFIDARE